MKEGRVLRSRRQRQRTQRLNGIETRHGTKVINIKPALTRRKKRRGQIALGCRSGPVRFPRGAATLCSPVPPQWKLTCWVSLFPAARDPGNASRLGGFGWPGRFGGKKGSRRRRLRSLGSFNCTYSRKPHTWSISACWPRRAAVIGPGCFQTTL